VKWRCYNSNASRILWHNPHSTMEQSTSSLYLAVPIGLAALATWWAIWPERYVKWLQSVKEKVKVTPAMRAGVDRVEAVLPWSSSKPWYPKFLRVAGILIWAMLLSVLYMAYKF
jgi:hypothetical protein